MNAADLHAMIGLLWPAWRADVDGFCAAWGEDVRTIPDAAGAAAVKAHARVSAWPPSLAEFLRAAGRHTIERGGPACQRCHQRLPESGRCPCPEPAPGSVPSGWKLDAAPQMGRPPRPAGKADMAMVQRTGIGTVVDRLAAGPRNGGDGAAPAAESRTA